MYAAIEVDLINEPGMEIPTREGMVIGDARVEGKMCMFRALDDDRIPYYIGFSDDAALEYVFEWCQIDAGTTILQCLDLKTLEWKDEVS